MHCERHVCSAEESDVPGLGMQASKQCSLTLPIRFRALVTAASCRTWFMRWVLMSASPEDAVLELEDPQMAILLLVF